MTERVPPAEGQCVLWTPARLLQMFPTAPQAAARQRSAEVARPQPAATVASTQQPAEPTTRRAVTLHAAAILSAEAVAPTAPAALSQQEAALHVEAAV